jgi:hypothetical protein
MLIGNTFVRHRSEATPVPITTWMGDRAPLPRHLFLFSFFFAFSFTVHASQTIRPTL